MKLFKPQILLFLISVCLLASCTKKEVIIQEEHTNTEIDNNTAPPFSGITTVQANNYINKVYIDLFGRTATDVELDNARSTLQVNNFSSTDLDSWLSSLMTSDAYYQQLFDLYSTNYLGSVDQEYLEVTIQLIDAAIIEANQAGNDPLAQSYLIEQEKLVNLLEAPTKYQTGEIDITEMMSRIVYNLVYDEINMGSENFVLACFENLHKRLPTETELEASVDMVDGFGQQLLLKDGNSKRDFIEIITTTPGFYEGLSIDIYQNLLSRYPEPSEMGEATAELIATQDYQTIQRKIMISEEYTRF